MKMKETRYFTSACSRRIPLPAGREDLFVARAGPVADIRLEHPVFEALRFEHGLGDVIEGNHAKQHPCAHHGNVARMTLQHQAPHFVDFGIGSDGDRVIVHVLAHGAAADAAAVKVYRLHHFAEGQHVDLHLENFGYFHDHTPQIGRIYSNVAEALSKIQHPIDRL